MFGPRRSEKADRRIALLATSRAALRVESGATGGSSGPGNYLVIPDASTETVHNLNLNKYPDHIRARKLATQKRT